MHQILHVIFRSLDVDLPELGHYATGIIFTDKDTEKCACAEQLFENLASECKLKVF